MSWKGTSLEFGSYLRHWEQPNSHLQMAAYTFAAVEVEAAAVAADSEALEWAACLY